MRRIGEFTFRDASHMLHKANAFGSFLQTMNTGRPDTQPFDREASAKLVLQQLPSRNGPATPMEVAALASITLEQADEVIAYLVESGMVEQSSDGRVILSGFGQDALGVFAV